jgi:hypothetical protein
MPNDEQKEVKIRLGLYKQAITELLGFYGELGVRDGKGKTEAAWDYLLGLGRKVYCNPKQPPLLLDGVAGVHVYILGPPEAPEFLRKRRSTKETYQESQPRFSLIDSFLAAVAGDAANPELRERAIPFDKDYRISVEAAQQIQFFRDRYGFAEGDAGAWRRIDHDWLTMTGELALQLDSYTNNTCLALAIELVESGKVLLFPGDAQVGNWLSWAELSWQVKDAAGQAQTVTPGALLARTVFYKVGHHGSHNATLRTKGLEKMDSPELVAMIPVHRETAKDQDWEFPYPPLWKQLQVKARGRVLLADAKDDSDIEQEVRVRLSPEERKSFQEATTYSDLYIEYRIVY